MGNLDLDALIAASREMEAALSASDSKKGKKSVDPDKDAKQAERKAKREAKQAELKAGGHRAADKDWVKAYAEGRISRTTRQTVDVQIKVRFEDVPKQPKLEKLSDEERQEALDRFTAPKPARQSVPPPKPAEERTVEELYTLLVERWTRYTVVLAKPDKQRQPGDKKAAFKNFSDIAKLLMAKGESEDTIVRYIQGQQEGGE